MKKPQLAIALAFGAVTATAAAGDVEDQIRFRQSAYSFLGWNTAKIKAQASDHPDTFNKDEVIAAANAIAGVANAGVFEKLYGPGTDKGTGWKPSRLKPEFFEKQDEAKEINATFIKEANELQKVAAGGDPAAIKAQFGKLAAACKSCHDLIRIRQ
ncbi:MULTISPECIES: cytochrome c [Methylomicrobium]|uniref:Cytochrome c556 n=1 Tax=Methylomicrobium album BG8 TaxID=686340 RepID=H8GH16_METAL|nr:MULTISPECIES: cytochrome c [Methylomicrobium]EIC31291.1 cytochrome c556 [Methylomicrobium album BG8]